MPPSQLDGKVAVADVVPCVNPHDAVKPGEARRGGARAGAGGICARRVVLAGCSALHNPHTPHDPRLPASLFENGAKRRDAGAQREITKLQGRDERVAVWERLKKAHGLSEWAKVQFSTVWLY